MCLGHNQPPGFPGPGTSIWACPSWSLEPLHHPNTSPASGSLHVLLILLKTLSSNPLWQLPPDRVSSDMSPPVKAPLTLLSISLPKWSSTPLKKLFPLTHLPRFVLEYSPVHLLVHSGTPVSSGQSTERCSPNTLYIENCPWRSPLCRALLPSHGSWRIRGRDGGRGQFRATPWPACSRATSTCQG